MQGSGGISPPILKSALDGEVHLLHAPAVSTEQEAGLSPSQPGCIGGDKHLTAEGIEL